MMLYGDVAIAWVHVTGSYSAIAVHSPILAWCYGGVMAKTNQKEVLKHVQ